MHVLLQVLVSRTQYTEEGIIFIFYENEYIDQRFSKSRLRYGPASTSYFKHTCITQTSVRRAWNIIYNVYKYTYFCCRWSKWENKKYIRCSSCSLQQKFSRLWRLLRIHSVEYKAQSRRNICSCGSVVEHGVSSAKVVGSIPREHTYWQKMYSLNVRLCIKASAKCINVNVISCTISFLTN